jgi:hypothetical protein
MVRWTCHNIGGTGAGVRGTGICAYCGLSGCAGREAATSVAGNYLGIGTSGDSSVGDVIIAVAVRNNNAVGL